MIRSAAKNHKDVSVLVDPSQYQNFLEESKKGELKESYKAKLALEAFQHTADSVSYTHLTLPTKA